MPIMFNTVLAEAGLNPSDVSLLRYQDNRSKRGRTPYELWRDDPPAFDSYQSRQRIERRAEFRRPCWASFVGTPDDGTMFVGLFHARFVGNGIST